MKRAKDGTRRGNFDRKPLRPRQGKEGWSRTSMMIPLELKKRMDAAASKGINWSAVAEEAFTHVLDRLEKSGVTEYRMGGVEEMKLRLAKMEKLVAALSVSVRDDPDDEEDEEED